MIKSKGFWIVQNVVIVAFWLAAVTLLATGQSQHRLVLLAAIILAAHVLELPLAFGVLRGRGVSPIKTLLLTLVFGFTWWLPVRRGIYAA